jgi:ATP-dependent DNA helicase DinG
MERGMINMSFPINWRPHFPYQESREIQAISLDYLFANWDRADVFVLQAPTAYGKSSVGKTLMNVFRSVSMLTPNNLLVDQFLGEFQDTRTLRRMDSYRCCTWDRPCSVTRAKLLNFCKGGVCQCSADLAQAKYKKGPGIYNYHIYHAHQIFRDILIVDEAHNIIKYLQDRQATKIWRHDYKYPLNMYSVEQMKKWIDTLTEKQRKHKKIRQLENAVSSLKPEFIPQRAEEEFNGRGTERGKPEIRDCIKLLPVDVRDVASSLWPVDKVHKIILMSATINHHDIEALGLNRLKKRVMYINCESPIEASRRPIYLNPLVNVSHHNLDDAIEIIAEHIENELLNRHIGEKGVIHVTYQMADLLRDHLRSPRFMFHSRDAEDKRSKYQQFRDSPPDSGRVLVACGMYEGIDLPDDLGRWQVIAKVPWPSLASPALRYMLESNPSLYDWETLRTVIQGCGRICRTPTDDGCTYILDGTIFKLLDRSIDLTPMWWRDGLIDCRR